jgi:hypothetical protein
MADQGTPEPRPLDPVGHLLAELKRLDLILWRHVRERNTGAVPPGLAPVTFDHTADVTELLSEHTKDLGAALAAARAAGTRLPLLDLCQNLELDAGSVGVLVLGLAPHVDRHYERVFAWLQGEAVCTAPRVDLALELFAPTPAARLAFLALFQPTAPLFRSGLVRLADAPDGPANSDLGRLIRVSPRILRYLTDQPGAELEVEAARAEGPLPEPTASLLGAANLMSAVLARGSSVPDRPCEPIAVLRSEDPAAALATAAAIAQRAGLPALLIDLSRPSAARYPVERVIEAAVDEARLLGALLAIAGFDDLDERGRGAALRAATMELQRFDGACVLVARDAIDLRHAERRRAVLFLDAPPPDATERAELWARQLGGTTSEVAEIAALYRLGAGQIRDAARMAATLELASGPSAAHLRTAAQAQSRQGLGDLAQRVAPWGSWDDLVLPPVSLHRLRTIVDCVRHRETVFRDWGLGGKVASWAGVTAMFAGPPGTGKTLSASLIAQAIGLELFRIDLAGIVSKYIGETEKNLDRLFRAAYRTNAILFFDEADALFGKRTEVKDAHDRYANVETSYLLQKLEAFEGLAILATNLKKNIDPAFMRRIEVLVDFPFPNAASRLNLWTKLLVPGIPREPGLDLRFIAENFEVAGGHIKNAVQSAAFMAAAAGCAVGMSHLIHAVRWELQKQGKIASTGSIGAVVNHFPERDDAGGASLPAAVGRR